MEDNLACTKSQSFPQTKKSSSNLKSKSSEQNPSSTISKRVKKEEFENEEDLTNKILSNLTYENFESEQEKFYPHYRKKHEEIYINNVPLLDQNRFRFLISSNSNIFNEYTKYEKGNFKNIKWEDIKLVYYYYVEDYQCPICLENKLCCPIIINCGHIFCYPCFLNFYNYYILQNNQKLPKCPLCSEIIDQEKNAIKFCEMIQCKNYTNKMRIKFNLIMREKTSPTLFNLIYDPSLIKWKKSLKNQMNSIPFELSKEFIFSRIFFTNKTLMKERINNMINETKEALKEEKEFYADESKIKSLEQCIEILENIYNESAQEKDFIIENVFQKEKNNNIKNKFDNNNIILTNNNAKDNTNNMNNSNNDNIIKNEEEEINYKKYYLFYQEEEGDIYYLDPFIMDILLTEYGDYSNLPVEISGNILDVNMKQITQNIKSTYPYLSHLNLGSIIFFVEIDVNPLISPFTRNKFSHALNERAKRRRLLSNEEKNYEKFINKKSLKEKEEMQNYFLNFNKNIFKQEKKGGENNNNNNIKFNYKEEFNDNNDKQEEEKKEENKKNEDNDKNVKKENMLKKLFEEDKKEKEEEKERLEKERLEKEKKEREKKNIFVFDEKEFPELKNENKEKEKEKEKENNKGGKKGKKKGKKKFKDIEEDFLIDAFKPEETPKPKWKKSSKHD